MGDIGDDDSQIWCNIGGILYTDLREYAGFYKQLYIYGDGILWGNCGCYAYLPIFLIWFI